MASPPPSQPFRIQWSRNKLNSDVPFSQNFNQSEAPNTFRPITSKPLVRSKFRANFWPLQGPQKSTVTSTTVSSQVKFRLPYANELFSKTPIDFQARQLVTAERIGSPAPPRRVLILFNPSYAASALLKRPTSVRVQTRRVTQKEELGAGTSTCPVR